MTGALVLVLVAPALGACWGWHAERKHAAYWRQAALTARQEAAAAQREALVAQADANVLGMLLPQANPEDLHRWPGSPTTFATCLRC